MYSTTNDGPAWRRVDMFVWKNPPQRPHPTPPKTQPMTLAALSCPQCGGPLPRQAAWRMVACPQCRAVVTRSSRVVERQAFHAAWLRSRAVGGEGDRLLRIGARTYRVLATLAQGDRCEVLSALACAAPPERVTIKLAAGANTLAHEAQALGQLQRLDGPDTAYFSQRLPQVVACGATDGDLRDALVLRRPPGFRGTLADVLACHPHGLREPRHAVWLWRRVLEVLAYAHGAGWTHGDLRASHWLVNPADHGVMLIGWGLARPGGSVARDLMQSAWTMRALLHGPSDDPPVVGPHVPAPLAALLHRASEDTAWCTQQGAAGIERQLAAAARQAFGAPRFIPFNPQQA
jgi:hypothetical protein